MEKIMKTNYSNLFLNIGKTEEEVRARLEQIKTYFFEGGEDERVYYPVGADMAYIEDTGNHDVRTEGMSYGMMFAVQLDQKEVFDRLWKWAKTYMYMEEGENEGYFAWSCGTDGSKNAMGPAPDGEEFFAMALFFAAHRWGDGEGIFNYSEEAKAILSACLHKGEKGRVGHPMWNRENKQILFVPGSSFTDPSYHLPHFYELFAAWANEEDRDFFKEAAKVSREYLVKACHTETGMCAEYAEFDGTPMKRPLPWTTDRHDWFFSDAYRTVANIGIDYEWCSMDVGQCKAATNLQYTLGVMHKDTLTAIYEIDGTPIEGGALHPTGMIATTAQGALAVVGHVQEPERENLALEWVERFWNLPMRTGRWRYYDNCLYFFAFLALSGNYRIW